MFNITCTIMEVFHMYRTVRNILSLSLNNLFFLKQLNNSLSKLLQLQTIQSGAEKSGLPCSPST